MTHRNLQARFWARVDVTGDCWQWTGGKNNYGYGRVRVDGRDKVVHRLSFEWANGPIPAGYLVDHLCFNTLCVNPEHLRLATRKQNGENRAGPQKNSKSGVRGVYRLPSGRWAAEVRSHKKLAYREIFDTPEQAAEAVSAARRRILAFSQEDIA